MAKTNRPLSPHLQVYRWQVQMVTSILHRATGIVLAAGALLAVYGVVQLALGREAWQAFADCLGSPLGLVFLFGWTWAFSVHFLNGIRHLFQDAGMGFQIPSFVRNSWFTVIGSVLLTLVIFCIGLMHKGGVQ